MQWIALLETNLSFNDIHINKLEEKNDGYISDTELSKNMTEQERLKLTI